MKWFSNTPIPSNTEIKYLKKVTITDTGDDFDEPG
jgi:hypothetical protein